MYYKKTHKRTSDERKTMSCYKAQFPKCEACGIEQTSDAHHIVTEGSGGDTEDWNLFALCRICHTTLHMMGWKKACERYPHLAPKIITARVKMGRRLK
jgi:hypothetical protein